MTGSVVVVGAGIAGASVALQLGVRQGVRDLIVVDPRPPLTLTSDKSTECYRNWWPSQAMVGLMNRSIELLDEMAEETGNAFSLGRRGYLYVTADQKSLENLASEAATISRHGAGPVRTHPGPDKYVPLMPDGYRGQPDGADLFTAGDELRSYFPFLTPRAVGGVHVRRAGWFSAQQLGAWMLETARESGATLLIDEVDRVEVRGGRVVGVELRDRGWVDASTVVDAAGPMAADVARTAGVELPLQNELHRKAAFRDHAHAVPRDAPMLIWNDPQIIPWTPAEASELRARGREDLLGEMPRFCHGRPEGGDDSPYVLALWEYHKQVTNPVWPIPEDSFYTEVVIRGMTTMVPALAAYSEGLPPAMVDGGYYTKTPENRPLIGPVGPDGFHVVTGLSGFGIMAAPAAADLLARHVTGTELPGYASAFLPSRYQDPRYLRHVQREAGSGQL